MFCPHSESAVLKRLAQTVGSADICFTRLAACAGFGLEKTNPDIVFRCVCGGKSQVYIYIYVGRLFRAFRELYDSDRTERVSLIPSGVCGGEGGGGEGISGRSVV